MEYFDFYEGVCKERLHLQGQTMQVSSCSCYRRAEFNDLLSCKK